MEKKTKILSLLLIVLFIACKSYKKEMVVTGARNQAIENCIVDYYNSNKKEIKSYKVFYVNVHDTINSEYYHLRILPEINKISIRKKDTLGSISDYFPTNYLYYKDKLFVWNDNAKRVNQEVIDVLHKNEILDSIVLKYQLGIYKDDWDVHDKYPSNPSVVIDESIEGVDYIVCKNKINIYRKIKKGTYRPYDTKLPRPKCN